MNSPSRMNDREPKWFSLFFRSILKYDCGTDTCESRVKNVTLIYADSFWLRPTYVLVYRSMSAVYPVPSAEHRMPAKHIYVNDSNLMQFFLFCCPFFTTSYFRGGHVVSSLYNTNQLNVNIVIYYYLSDTFNKNET